MSLRNPAAFFSYCRATVFKPRIEQNEVDGSNVILRYCEGIPISYAAYALATAWHETAHTMEPVKEYGGSSYFTRMYDIKGRRPHVAKVLGNIYPGDGAMYVGRGFVQLTGRTNYEKAAKVTGYPLVGNPDMAMRPDIAGMIMRHGMGNGWFTGKGFADYLPNDRLANRTEFERARRIINGTDRAKLIADYAVDFQDALKAGCWH